MNVGLSLTKTILHGGGIRMADQDNNRKCWPGTNAILADNTFQLLLAAVARHQAQLDAEDGATQKSVMNRARSSNTDWAGLLEDLLKEESND